MKQGIPGGVTIQIGHTRLSTLSDGQGNYTVGYIAGQFDVTYSKEGYHQEVISLNVAAGQQYPMQHITLREIGHLSPELLAASVVKTFTAQDFTSFSQFATPTKDELISLVRQEADPDYIDDMMTGINDRFLDQREELYQSWHDISQKNFTLGPNND